MNDWKPAAAGADFEFTRILKPLEPFRQDITVLSGLANHAAEKAQRRRPCEGTGSFLSGAPPKYTAGADVHAGMTFDQIVAQHWAIGHARSLAATWLRGFPHGGQLRHRFELRVHQHACRGGTRTRRSRWR